MAWIGLSRGDNGKVAGEARQALPRSPPPWHDRQMPADRAPAVLITGIHTDLGFALSHRFRREGWFVIGTDLGRQTGRNARVHISADITQPKDCEDIAYRAAFYGSGLDCVITCSDSRLTGPVGDLGSADWDFMMDVNAKSVFLLSTACVPYLDEYHGTIIAVTAPPADHPQASVYDASKAAVLALTESMAQELAPRGITVATVSPEEHGQTLDPDTVADRVWDLVSQARAQALAGTP